MFNHVDYEKECKLFINSCFVMLGQYKRHPEYYSDNNTMLDLKEPYAIKLNRNGQLSIVDKSKNNKTVAHSYNSKRYSQITYVGILLGRYLELLQMADI